MPVPWLAADLFDTAKTGGEYPFLQEAD